MVVPPTALNLLRTELRQRRQVVAKQYEDYAFRAPTALTDVLRAARCVGFYRPVGGEPDPLPLLDGYPGVTSLPFLPVDSTTMTFRSWIPGEPLMTSAWGVRQPTDAAPVVKPDVILVPLLGFDAAFSRIGQGGGHYDRYLAAHPHACRIGIAWEGQRVDSIDAQPWDVPLDAVLTDTDFHVKDLTRCQRP
jgi:5-formyltetrahydrofolate cyclo-ligase